MTVAQLAEAVEQLRVARESHTLSSASLKQSLDAFNAANGNIIAQVGQDKVRVSLLEEQVRIIGAKVFEVTKEKEPTAGVTVKVESSLEYEDATVIAWLKDFAPGLLLTTFDREAFTVMVEGMLKSKKIVPCVRVKETPKVSISKKLAPAPAIDNVTPTMPPAAIGDTLDLSAPLPTTTTDDDKLPF